MEKIKNKFAGNFIFIFITSQNDEKKFSKNPFKARRTKHARKTVTGGGGKLGGGSGTNPAPKGTRHPLVKASLTKKGLKGLIRSLLSTL